MNEELWLVVLITVLLVLFHGEPDLIDAMIHYLMDGDVPNGV